MSLSIKLLSTILLAFSYIQFAIGNPDTLIDIPLDKDLNTNASWFNEQNCKLGQNNTFAFQVGKEVFSIPKQYIEKGLLQRSPLISKAQQGDVVAKMPADIGCNSNPFPFSKVDLNLNKPDFPKYVILSETPQQSKVAMYIKHLSSQGSCVTTKFQNLVSCSGSRTAGNQKIGVTFLVITSTDNHANMGGSDVPIHARCESLSNSTACWVSEEMNSQVSAKANLNVIEISPESIIDLREKIIKFVSSIKK
ncbi:MAG TPA: hypothetical protein VK950_02830 [Methylophilus sp.]|nr:hypothetical protein [Methylophilus sp.]